MRTVDFLQAVWPAEGIYCVIHGPYPHWEAARAAQGDVYFKQRGFATVEAAASFALGVDQTLPPGVGVFFNVNTLINGDATGNKSVKRTHDNCRSAKAFISDLDVGEGKPFATQEIALKALLQFCEDAQLPRPMLVSSGYGIHCYWVLTEEIDSATWKAQAETFKALADHHGFEIDPSRVSDRSSVLRVPGTMNRKKDREAKVRVLGKQKEPIAPADWKAMLHAASIFLPDPELATYTVEEDNLPTTAKVATDCGVFARMIAEAATSDEPTWYNFTNLCLFTSDGHDEAHRISALHPEYDPAETGSKMAQARAKGVKPLTCGKLAKTYVKDNPCLTCWYRGNERSSPIIAAQKRPTTELPEGVPPVPTAYRRMADGIYLVSADPAIPSQKIIPYDVWPTEVQVDEVLRKRAVTWTIVHPKNGEEELLLPFDVVGDSVKLVQYLGNAGYYLEHTHSKKAVSFMSAYLRDLQKYSEDRKQLDNFGWTTDFKSFVLRDGAYSATGVKKVPLADGLRNVLAATDRKGDLATQVRRLKFYDHPAYFMQQYLIASSMASILMHMTPQYGVVINLTGESGASKSTSLYAAAAVWGNPTAYAMSGTAAGGTPKGRMARRSALASLPVCIDEITLMSADEAKELTMSVTQPGPRVVSQTQGGEKTVPENHKATILLCSSNNSLHALLSENNAAGTANSMRVVEITAVQNDVRTKADADKFLMRLREDYGNIGPAWVDYVVRNYDQVKRDVEQICKEVDKSASIQQHERFWSVSIALAIYAIRKGRELGLLPFDPEAFSIWAVDDLVHHMRGDIKANYADPISSLSNFINFCSTSTLVVDRLSARDEAGNTHYAIREPRGRGIDARLEGPLLEVQYATFAKWCSVHGQTRLDKTLTGLGVITRDRAVLGRGIVAWNSAQVRVLRIDLRHELLAGVAAPIEGTNIVKFPKKPKATDPDKSQGES